MTTASDVPGRSAIAAFFDLDGVLIRGTSGVALCADLVLRGRPPLRALAHAVLAAGLFALGSRSRFATHEVVGRLLAGRRVEAVAQTAARLAGVLAADIVPCVRSRIESHARAGHVVALASAAPHPIAAALGERLGIEHVLGTRYAVAAGRYTGALESPVMLGEHKAAVAAAWAARLGVHLQASYAYCNDFSDRWLLAAVGHPIVVRPERRLRAWAKARGWQELAADASGRLRRLQ